VSAGRVVLLDERQAPSVRDTMVRLLANAERADLAIARVRLAAIDLNFAELATLRCCRLLLARLDAELLHDVSLLELAPERGRTLRKLLDWAKSGRLEVRSAGRLSWIPDFSVYHDVCDAVSVALIGAHYFQPIFTGHGTALTCCVRQEAIVRRVSERFHDLWERGYDVLPVIAEGLAQTLDAVPNSDAAPGGVYDPAIVLR
jgi:hypothetical protein